MRQYKRLSHSRLRRITISVETDAMLSRTIRALFFSIALAAAAACGGTGSSTPPAQSASPSPSPAQGNAAIDAAIEQSYPGPWGVELAIYRNGTPLYVRGYGLRDRGLPDLFLGPNIYGLQQPDVQLHLPRGRFPPDIDTIFDVGSVSKEFTAGAILLLQQDGKLSVNDPLSTYFPAIPHASSIPLIYLLQHRSGLVEYNNFGNYPDFTGAYNAFMASGQSNYQPIADALAAFPLDFTPGTQYEYSNTNYVLLAMIAAKVSGEPFGTFLQQRIFGPLGMTETAQGYPQPPVRDLALGYKDVNGTIARAWQWNLQWLAGPGGLTSTVRDLEKWDEALRRPGIFTQASLRSMFAPSPISLPYGSYADGWFIASLDGHAYVWHDGAIGGFQSVNATFPNDRIDIIILTNDFTGPDPYYVIPQLFPIALGAPSP